MTSLACICPQEIAAANHKIKTAAYWADPEYQAIVAKRIEGETCHYCRTRPATLAHHDEDWMYRPKEAYYNPENMTPICWPCHENYRRGLVICPSCHEHYMRRDSDKCQYCRGVAVIGKNGKRSGRSHVRRHPCRFNLGAQRCSKNGVCHYSPAKAEGCRKFERKEWK